MASVAPPKPTYRPKLPAAVLRDGLLSDAQLDAQIGQGSIFDLGAADGGASSFAAPSHPPIPIHEFERTELLAREKRVDGRGNELSQAGLHGSVARGLSVLQGDADTDLVN